MTSKGYENPPNADEAEEVEPGQGSVGMFAGVYEKTKKITGKFIEDARDRREDKKIKKALEESGESSEKAERSVQIVRWFRNSARKHDEQYLLNNLPQRNEYTNEYDSIELERLIDIAQMEEDPQNVLDALLTVTNEESLNYTSFWDVAPKIAEIPNYKQNLEKLAQVSHLRISVALTDERNSLLEILESEAENPGSILAPQYLQKLDRLAETINAEMGTRYMRPLYREKDAFSFRVGDVKPLAELQEDEELFNLVTHTPLSISNSIDPERIGTYAKRALIVRDKLPQIMELNYSGVDVDSTLEKLVYDSRADEIDWESPDLDEELNNRLRILNVPAIRQKVDDRLFLENARIIKKTLGFKTRLYETDTELMHSKTEEVEKATKFFRDVGNALGINVDYGDETYTWEHPSKWEQFYESFPVLKAAFSAQDPENVDRFIDILRDNDLNSLLHRTEDPYELGYSMRLERASNFLILLTSERSGEEVQRVLETVTSRDAKELFENSAWVLDHMSEKHRGVNIANRYFMESLLSGDFDKNIAALWEVSRQRERFDDMTVKFKNDGVAVETNNFEDIYNLLSLNEEQWKFISDTVNVRHETASDPKAIRNNNLVTILPLAQLDQQEREAMELELAPYNLRLAQFFHKGMSEEAVAFFAQNHSQVLSGFESYLSRFPQESSGMSQEEANRLFVKQHVTHADFNKGVYLYSHIARDPTFLDTLEILHETGYKQEDQYYEQLAKVHANPHILETTKRIHDDTGHTFHPMNTDIIEIFSQDGELLKGFYGLEKLGYELTPRSYERVEPLLKNPEAIDFITQLTNRGYEFSDKHAKALLNLSTKSSEVLEFLENEKTREQMFEHITLFDENIPQDFEGFLKVGEKIFTTKSKEIKKLTPQILKELSKSDNPYEIWQQVESVFVQNHMPLAGKIYKVFELMQTPEVMEYSLNLSYDPSPTLVEASEKDRYRIIGQDVLKIHIETGNRSLRRYLETIGQGEGVFTKAETDGVNSLETEERAALETFLGRMESLYANTLRKGKKTVPLNTEGLTDDEVIEKRMSRVKRRMGINENEGFSQRLNQLYLEPFGFKSIAEVIERMNKAKSEASERNQEYISSGQLKLKPGDLLKGVKIEFLPDQQQNGIVTNEIFGQEGDSTPYDADAALVLEEMMQGESDTERAETAIKNSIATGYGHIMLVIRDRGQFRKTAITEDQRNAFPEEIEPVDLEDTQKYELFRTGVHGDQHVGIRTGIPYTEVDAIVVYDSTLENQLEMERLKFHIAQNGIDIPLFDTKGNMISTPLEMDAYRMGALDIESIVNQDEITPAKLFAALKQNPYLRELFEEDSGVWEGFNLEEHSGMVLNQFEENFSGSFSSDVMSKGAFRTMLTLHDIGKPVSVTKTGGTLNQHEYTEKIVKPIFDSMGFDDIESDLAISIVSGDYLGHYLNPSENYSLEETIEEIKVLAGQHGIDASQVYPLLKTYFMSDASAYTQEAHYEDLAGNRVPGKSSLDHIFTKDDEGKLTFSPEYQEKVVALENALLGG